MREAVPDIDYGRATCLARLPLRADWRLAVNGEAPVILALCDYYLPGYKAGGAIRSMAGMIEHLGLSFQFRLLTRDRDRGDAVAYSLVRVKDWTDVGQARVMYLEPSAMTLRRLRSTMRAVPHDVLYLNSLFSIPFSIGPLVLRRLALVPRSAVVVAPRGELAKGALALHRRRKRAYLVFIRLFGSHRHVLWQASGPDEAADVQRAFGRSAQVRIARDLSPSSPSAAIRLDDEKVAGRLRLLFLSRISRKKNLEGALRMLRGVIGIVEFDIYGPIEDETYWQECQSQAAALPANITVTYRGPVSRRNVADVVTAHDLLFLPTFGENFGHVILEALANGCPVLISDRTYWHDLESAGVGWDLPLEAGQAFQDTLNRCVAMAPGTWSSMSERARRFGTQRLRETTAVESNRDLLIEACRGRTGGFVDAGATDSPT